MSWNDDDPWGSGPPREPRRRPRGSSPRPPELPEWAVDLQKRLSSLLSAGGPGMGMLLLFLGVLIIWGLSGIYRVLPEEQGVVTRFGAYHRIVPPGLHYHLPWPMERVFRPRVTIVNRIDIGMRVLDAGTFVNFRQPRDVPEESLMLTGDENIVDVDFSVFWVISNAPFYLFNIQNPEGAIKAVAESVMREIIGTNKIQPVLTQDRQKIEEEVKALMQTTLTAYGAGVEVQQVKMQKVDPPGAVIDSFRDVQAARADQERASNEAHAYGNRVIPETRGEGERLRREAEAYRERTVAESEGEALRFLSVYREYRNASDVTRRRLFLETMERVFKGANKVIIDSKNSSGVVPYLPLDRLQQDRSAGGRR